MKAIEAVDECLGAVVDLILEKGGAAIITADHGNADYMLTHDNKPCKSHSLNPVPFILINTMIKNKQGLKENGSLSVKTNTHSTYFVRKMFIKSRG